MIAWDNNQKCQINMEMCPFTWKGQAFKCDYLQSNVAGRIVTSFPRCLLVRVVECLKMSSSSSRDKTKQNKKRRRNVLQSD